MKQQINILIIRLSSIGDIFHTLTVLPDIKKKFPDSNIDWCVDESFAKIVKLSPLINDVLPIPLRKWKKNKLTWFFHLLDYKKKINSKKYDYIIDTQGLIKSAFIAKFLFNGELYGLDKNSAREPLASLFYDYKFLVKQNDIAVVRLRGLIAKIFNIDIDYNQIDLPIIYQDCGIDLSINSILFLHGTSKQSKKWDIDNWKILAEYILENSDNNIYLTYSNSEEEIFTNKFKLLVNNSRIKIVDKMEFSLLADLINKVKLVIGVDTGFTHLANLLGKPTLAIYQDSDPSYVGIFEYNHSSNFGGRKNKVLASEIIDYISVNKLI